MTTRRDTRRPLEYWDEMLALKQQYVHSKDQVALYHQRMQDENNGIQPVFHFMDAHANDYLEDITYCYCRGDDLDSIKSHYIDEGIDRFVFVCGEI